MLRILLGRARTGKSARVLDEIRALGDASKQILLVPEHASHAAEVDVCRACGPTAGRHAEVLTFKLLASRVLALTGGAADVRLPPSLAARGVSGKPAYAHRGAAGLRHRA